MQIFFAMLNWKRWDYLLKKNHAETIAEGLKWLPMRW
jgi:hypothetical protein